MNRPPGAQTLILPAEASGLSAEPHYRVAIACLCLRDRMRFCAELQESATGRILWVAPDTSTRQPPENRRPSHRLCGKNDRMLGNLLDDVFWSIAGVLTQTIWSGGRKDAEQARADPRSGHLALEVGAQRDVRRQRTGLRPLPEHVRAGDRDRHFGE